MARELISPLVSVEVLDAANGEAMLVPPVVKRVIFHRDWKDLISMRRVSITGSVKGTYGYGGIGLPHMGSSIPLGMGDNLPGSWLKSYLKDSAALFAEIPVGFDAILVDEPIRGVIPAPVISTIRSFAPSIKEMLSSPYFEDLFGDIYGDGYIGKYAFDKWVTPAILRINPVTGWATLYMSVTFEEKVEVSAREQGGIVLETEEVRLYPVLFPVLQEVEMTLLGLNGKFFLVTAIGEDYPYAGDIDRRTLFAMGARNVALSQEGFQPDQFFVKEVRQRTYDMGSGQLLSESVTPYISLPQPTLRSVLLESPPLPFGDYGFMFVLQLNTPLDQRYHLFSMSSVARIYFGGHYILEFLPSAGGVGKTRFYFLPKGYYIPQGVWDNSETPVHPQAATMGTSATIWGSQEIFLMDAFLPKPIADSDIEKTFPYVFVQEISDTDVWSFSKVTPGASAEAFLVLPLASHICIFRYSDIQRSVAEGTPLKPLIAFNPLEYVHRNFGSTPLGQVLLQKFRQHIIPPFTSVGAFFANCSAYLGFCDVAWRGYSIATKPITVAPDTETAVSIAQGNTVYIPFSLVGTGNIPKLTTYPPEFKPNYMQTIPPPLKPLTPTPPATTLHPPYQFLYYPIVYVHPASGGYPKLVPLPCPIAEIQEETLGGATISTAPVSAISARITCPSSLLIDIKQMNTRVALTTEEGVHIGGVIPATDLGFSPNYFVSYEEWLNAYRNFWGTEPKVLYEGKMFSMRYFPAPPVLKAVDIVRCGVFQIGDVNWETAVDLAAIPAELGETSGVIKSISINLQPEAGSSTATINLELPYNVEPAMSPEDNIIINLPPLLKELLRPYNLIRIRLGYVLADERTVLPTLSPIIFEGVITGVTASITERELGGRALRVTINANDIFYRAAQATVEDDPPMDGRFLPEVIEHQLLCSGIFPDRLISNLWFPLGAAPAYFVGDNLFVGGNDAYLLYSDFPFSIDFGLITLADAPRYQVQPGSRRLEVIKQALRLTGTELIYTPFPIPTDQTLTFLDFLMKSFTYEKFGGRVKAAIRNAKLPYISPTIGRQTPKAQVLPIGAYATRPTWVFQAQMITTPSIDEVPVTPNILSVPIALPNQPYIYGMFSLQWQQAAWALPTYVAGEGERLQGQPFVFSFYDYYHDLFAKNNPLFKGFRISSFIGRNQNIVDPIQAWLAAWRERLRLGYFPPISATLNLFGMPILAPKHLVGISPALRMFGMEDWVVSDPTGGITFWVVRDITYEWSADAPATRMQVNLVPPHKFLAGLFGLG